MFTCVAYVAIQNTAKLLSNQSNNICLETSLFTCVA